MTHTHFLLRRGALLTLPVIALLIVLSTIPLAGAAPAAQGGTLRIGYLGTSGTETANGAQLAIDQINAIGGITAPDGGIYTLELVTLDVMPTVDTISADANTLVGDGVAAILGPDDNAQITPDTISALAATRLEVELFRHEDERGEIVRNAFSSSLCQAIDLEDAETTARVCEAIKALVHDDDVEEAAGRLEGMLRDYERQKQRELAAIEEAEGARLRELGVSGSAIRLNPQEHESWRQSSSELQQTFRPQVDEIKRELTDHLVSSLRRRQQ